MDVKIFVSTHKKYIFPEDDIYIPVQVGIDEGAVSLGYQKDNEGDNISYKHRYYSDLSTVYWVWKNVKVDYVGVCHYRRYFVSKIKKNRHEKKLNYILTEEEIKKILKRSNIIVPKKRNYYIETIESHYRHTHNSDDYDIFRSVISDIFPEYLESFDKVSNSHHAHLFNCFIMKKELFDDYCSFIFPILFEVENRIDFSNRSLYDSRVCGYLAEFLLDTWIIKNDYNFIEQKLSCIEKERKIKKAIAFLNAKFFNKKYEKSF